MDNIQEFEIITTINLVKDEETKLKNLIKEGMIYEFNDYLKILKISIGVSLDRYGLKNKLDIFTFMINKYNCRIVDNIIRENDLIDIIKQEYCKEYNCWLYNIIFSRPKTESESEGGY